MEKQTCVRIDSIWHISDKHCWLTDISDKGSSVHLQAFFEKDFLSAKAARLVVVTEKWTRRKDSSAKLVTRYKYSEMNFVALVNYHANRIRNTYQDGEVYTPTMIDLKTIVKEYILNVRILADDFALVTSHRVQLFARNVSLTTIHVTTGPIKGG